MKPPSSNPVCRRHFPGLAPSANCMRRVYLRLRMAAQLLPSASLGRSSRLWSALVLSLVGLAACDKMPLVAPSGTAITLISATNTLPVNGSVDITALLIEGGLSTDNTGTTVTPGAGTPVHNGTSVTFSTTLGRIEPAEAKTLSGRAVVKLIADGRSGIALITAYSGASSQTLEVNIGAAGASRLVVTATPQSLPATGGTSTVSARVEDPQGNGLLGVPVSFSTTAGSLAATNVLSNDQGFAATQLTTTQAATVTASAGGATAALSGTVAITLRPRTTIELTAPASATIGVPASFTVVPGANTIITDVVVDFGDGTSLSLDSVSSSRSFSHLFADFGVKRIVARATDSEGVVTTAATEVVVSPMSVSLSMSPGSLTTTTTATFTATVPANASILRYEWNFGDGTTAQTTAPQVQHRFPSAVEYTVSLRVVPTVGPAATVLLPVVIN